MDMQLVLINLTLPLCHRRQSE